MPGVLDLLSFDNVVFSYYAFYTTVVLLKVLGLGLLTSFRRLTKKSFSNQEDVDGFANGKGKPEFANPDIERVRRNHLNDLENVPVFVFLGLLYVATQPAAGVALWHFRIFTISRFLHTFVYQCAIPQPARALCHTVGLFVNGSMALRILSHASF